MRIEDPRQEQIPQLRKLWQEAFGDGEDFLDLFFYNVFSPDRCRCLSVDGQVAAALYWLDCRVYGRPVAYLYAVATRKAFQNRGLCAALMADTHTHLKRMGYAGAILVPGEPALFRMYDKMGYRICCGIGEQTCRAGREPMPLRSLDAAEYARLRRERLPEGGAVQEGENLTFLENLVKFYAGEDVLLCASVEKGKLRVPELLGDVGKAPRILAALDVQEGTFRFPGGNRSFAMYHPFTDSPAPKYFGLAFD